MIQFKDLKQGYNIYILNRRTVEIKQGKVMSVSFPRYEAGGGLNNTRMVVDVSVGVDGNTATYVMTDSSCLTYANDLVIATEKAGLLQEIEALKSNAEQVLATVDNQKEIIKKTTELLSDINPGFKQMKETDERFGKIEGEVRELKNMISEFIKKLE